MASDNDERDVQETKVEQPESAVEQSAETTEELDFHWYMLKVAVNRETNIRNELERRVRANASVSAKVKEIIVPIEKVEESRRNRRGEIKRIVVSHKKFPGYIGVHMIMDEESWFLVRETPGVGDFTGSFGRRSADGSFVKPLPMTAEEEEMMLAGQTADAEVVKKAGSGLTIGEIVRVIEGTMKDYEGEVSVIDELSEKVTIKLVIMGKITPVTFSTWQVEKVEV